VPDLLMVVLPALRVFRALRVLRLFRAMRAARALMGLSVMWRQWQDMYRVGKRRGLGFVLLAVAVLMLGGSYLMLLLEAGAGTGFDSYPDGLWWALVTMTTVGYGDVVPVSPAGRIIAAVFQVFGIAVFGIVTASISVHFVVADRRDEEKAVLERLAAIEARLTALMEQTHCAMRLASDNSLSQNRSALQ
jgi:voltage-gated potassium channel